MKDKKESKMQEQILECVDIVKQYQMGETKVHALNGINCSFARGELAAIIGPSGSGKSTLLNIMGGLDTQTSGELLFCSKNLSSMKEKQLAEYRRDKVGFVFQNYSLLEGVSVWDNVLLPALLDKKKVSQERVQELLDAVGLSDKLHAMPGELSGGQQQRVAIARALVNEPALLLCDEPTGNLDVETSDRIIALLREVNQRYGTTIILVTHNMEIAGRCDRMIKIVDGRIAEQ